MFTATKTAGTTNPSTPQKFTMKARLFAPIAVVLVCLLCLIGINVAFPQSALSNTEVANYLIKPLQADRVLFVQPRLAAGNLTPESLWTSLEEIAQSYYIRDSKLHIKQVNGREIPGLLVFTSPLTAEAPMMDAVRNP